ncbi:hypothetical protein PENDEC_c060G02266 [Penicillium decumbens]|uniref:Uncharacterized protein n=1 Tax=Penicillium decumbens TaxID=69771 RepID=A0A1V6NNK0_PENDC|nr:hypothetical protein PENDEC_c060G02266 [Penicillium decumbens]
MPSGLHVLYSPNLPLHESGQDQKTAGVDIVAVHGLAEDSRKAWTQQEQGVLWLRDLLPRSIHNARVLTFDYNSEPFLFTGSGFMETVQGQATTLVANLEAERSLINASQRPLIFVCHGLGGIIVKNALVHSASRTSHQTSHLNSVYVSTFAILLFGTPHDRIDIGKWLASSQSVFTTYDPGAVGNMRDSNAKPPITVHALDVITNQFAPLMKKIHLYLFWEGLATQLADGVEFFVEPSSAAPHTYDTERCGIMDSNHSGMVKFHEYDSSYRTVISALKKYCHSAPEIIAYRWKEAMAYLTRMRKSEASELTGLFLDIPDKTPIFGTEKKDTVEAVLQNEHFYPPCAISLDFIGQDDTIGALQKALEPEQNLLPMVKQKRFVLHGIGGSGKTQISAKYAQDNRKFYWAVFTIDASSHQTAKDSFCKIGKIGGLEATEDSGKHFLSQATKPWLLIIDNADSPDLSFKRLIVPGERGHILVTTRNPSLRRQGNVGNVELKGLKEEEAFRLLMKVADITPPWDPPTEMAGNEITKTLGYLALAVIQAGNTIYNKLCHLTEYLKFFQRLLENRRGKKDRCSTDDTDTRHAEFDDIFTAFDFSFQKIAIQKTVPSYDAIEILNVVGFYHFDSIPVDIFERGMNLEREQLRQLSVVSLRAQFVNAFVGRLRQPRALPRLLKQSIDGMHPLCIREALRELYASSLITYGKDEKSFSLHPLVHAWAKDRILSKERSLWAVIAFNTLMASIEISSQGTGEADSIFRRSLIPHLNSCLEACPTEFREFRSLKIGAGKFRRFMLLLQPTLVFTLREMIQNAAKCGVLYAQTGDFSKSAYHLSLVNESLVKLVGLDDARTMAAMLGLAGVLWGLGRLREAIDLQQQVVQARQKVLGLDHRETLQAMDSLGKSFWLNGQYCESLELQQQTAEKMRVHLGEEDDDTLNALDHLGVTLGSWRRFAESADIHQNVLTLRTRALQSNDLRVLETKSNLAMALLDLKQLHDARQLMEDVYNNRKLQMGKEHPYTLLALCYLSKIYIEQGEFHKAEETLVEGIAAGRRSLGEDHLGVLVGCGELARAYARQGRLDEAERLSLETVSKVKISRGNEHPDFAYGMWKLGELWEKKEEQAKAIKAYRTALTAIERRLTAKHPLYKIISDRITCLTENSDSNEPEDDHVANSSAEAGNYELEINRLQPTQPW